MRGLAQEGAATTPTAPGASAPSAASLVAAHAAELRACVGRHKGSKLTIKIDADGKATAVVEPSSEQVRTCAMKTLSKLAFTHSVAEVPLN